MSFYENTIVVRQDLPEKDLQNIKSKYSDIINNSSGKVVKIEDWGLINLATKIKNYNKGFFIHYKFEGNNKTLDEINKKVKIDSLVIRHLMVKYKSLETDIEYFSKDKKLNEKKK